jgi:hypothetical protein
VVATADADLLAVALSHRGATVTRRAPDEVVVTGVGREVIGRAALDIGAVVLEMHASGDDLESVFHSLVHPRESAS